MKKLLGIRFLVTLLCLILTVSVFVACSGGNGGGETGGNGETSGGAGRTETVTVANYTLLTSATADENVNEAAMILIDAVKQYTGADIVFKTDSEAASDYEILIGSTNRAESESVLSELNGQNGYVVKKVGNKIVINATSTAMLDDAANYFVNNYVSSGADGAFPVASDLCYTYGATGGFSLLDADNNCQYTLIYSQDVDTESNTRKDDSGNVVDVYNKGLDYIYQYIFSLWENLSEDTGSIIPIDTDFGSAKDENLEILVGRTNRPETKSFLSNLAPNEYGYGVVGNKLVIAGWGDLTTGLAVAEFLNAYENYIVEGDGVNNLVMSEGESKVSVYDKWSLDVPLYRGGELDGIVDLLDNGCQLYYTGATADSFAEYRTQIEAAGFELWCENQIGNNIYATYSTSKVMLHAYYVAFNNTVRVVTESMKTAVLPQQEDPYVKVTDTSFTMVDLNETVENFGNCFIITLEDGSFILHDGGGDASKADDKSQRDSREREELYNVLKALNKREDGEIVIAAWVISHAHWDHFKNTYDLIAKYYSEITVEKIIYSEPGETMIYNSYNPGGYITNGTMDKIATWTSAEIIKMHTGQTIQIRNLKIEAMLTVDDIYPEAVEKFNNTSLITRFDVGEGENKQRLMILGDTEEVGSKLLVDMYGEELKCDFMQVAHHGYGGSIELYRLCAPTVVLWPKDQTAVNAQLTGSTSSYYPGINQSLINQKNVKLLVVADNGHQTIMLPLLGITDNEEKNKDLVIVWERLDGR